MKNKYGIIMERSHVDDQVLQKGRMISYKINSDGRCEVVLQDDNGFLYETYEEFVVYEKKALRDIGFELHKKLDTTGNEIEQHLATLERCETYLRKQARNCNTDIKKCFEIQKAYDNACKRLKVLDERETDLRASYDNVMFVLRKRA